jgi:signal transduction histidine kinase
VTDSLLTVAISSEADVVAVRQRTRRVAELLGLDAQDQTRLATAVSEVARNALVHGGGGQADIRIVAAGARSILAVRIADHGPGIAEPDGVLAGASSSGRGLGLVSARRLCDHFTLASRPGEGTAVELGRKLPANRDPDDAATLAALVATLARESAGDPIAALRDQNRELLQSLAAVRERQDELDRLSRELEDTNRGVVALYHELDEKAAELRHASEVKSRFISNMSHEFRTPLNSTLALARLLLDRADGDLTAEQEKQVRFIRQSAESLLDLVNDLLDIARIEAGKVVVRPTPFEAADMLAGLRGMLKPLQAGHDVRLVFEPPAGLPTLFTDNTKLTQILRNLVTNALKFTPHGEVRVAAAPADAEHGPDHGSDHVTFTVSDTGIGIAAGDQMRIFEEFEQVESSEQLQNRGIGLGLPLSRRLAVLLGGRLTVSSTLGVGSTFRLTIPARHPNAPAALPSPDHMRVLLIDDEEASRYVLRRLIMAEPGWEVEEAATGLAGLQHARARRPDAILLDLNMPGLDGFAVLRELDADPATRGVPVVVCTSLHPDAALLARLPPGISVLSKSALERASLCAALREAAAREPAGTSP